MKEPELTSNYFWLVLGLWFLLFSLKMTYIMVFVPFPDYRTEVLLFSLVFNLAWNACGVALLFSARAPVILGIMAWYNLGLSIWINHLQYFFFPLTIRRILDVIPEALALVTHPQTFPLYWIALLPWLDLPLLCMLLWQRTEERVRELAPRRIPFVLVSGLVLALLLGFFFRFSHPRHEFQSTEASNLKVVHGLGPGFFMIGQHLWGKAETRLHYSPRRIESAGRASTWDVVLIQVECLDGNIVEKYVHGKPVMPNLLALSKKGVYFPYTLAFHKGGGTSDAEFSIINSVEPLANETAMKSSEPFVNSMIHSFSRAGYSTRAFHGNFGGFFNRTLAFPKMGFQEFFDRQRMGIAELPGCWGAPDHEVFEHFYNNSNNIPSPKLSFIITMSSHTYFAQVKKYPSFYGPFFEEIEPKIIRDYFSSMAYVDQVIGSITDKIDLSKTIVAIWGDHSLEASMKYPSYSASYVVERGTFEFVPFLLLAPHIAPYKEEACVASFLDIAPTILQAAGIPFVIRTSGVDLVSRQEMTVRIPFRGDTWSRDTLFEMAKRTKTSDLSPGERHH